MAVLNLPIFDVFVANKQENTKRNNILTFVYISACLYLQLNTIVIPTDFSVNDFDVLDDTTAKKMKAATARELIPMKNGYLM